MESLQDLLPAGKSTNQENDTIATEQEKPSSWEKGFNREDDIVAFPELNVTHGETAILPPLESSGVGLPPADWPHAGDNWSWSLQKKRVSVAGFYKDRLLTPPKRLQNEHGVKLFAGKEPLTQYIKKEFGEQKVDEFFKSFTWKIPDRDDAALNDENAQRKRKAETYEPVEKNSEATSQASSKRKKKEGVATASGPTEPESSQQKEGVATASGPTEPESSQQKEGVATASGPTEPESSQQPGGAVVTYDPHSYVSPMNDVLEVPHFAIDDDNLEEFDSYLNSLDSLLQLPLEDVGRDSSALVSAASPTRETEWSEARMKIASLLEENFPVSLLSSDATEIAALVTKLRKAPNLSSEEKTRLKVIEEITVFSKVFQVNREVIEEADSFFSKLKSNKDKVESLKLEYSKLRNEGRVRQMELETSTKAFNKRSDEIARLQVEQSKLKLLIENSEKERDRILCGQKTLAHKIANVVKEVQSSNSKIEDWELNKSNALNIQQVILSEITKKGSSVLTS